MKTFRTFLAVIGCLAGLFLLAVVTSKYVDFKQSDNPLPHSRIQYLKDSLEMEYYKRALEQSYPFNHSKIPTDESNTGVQSTR